MNQVFVTYARPDEAWATWVADVLESIGFAVELDKRSWRAGDDSIARMNEAVSRANIIVAVLSKSYFDPIYYSSLEGSAAQSLLLAPDKRVVPVRLDDTDPPPLLRPRISVRLEPRDMDKSIQRMLVGFLPLLDSARQRSWTVDQIRPIVAQSYPCLDKGDRFRATPALHNDIASAISKVAAGSSASLEALTATELAPLYVEQAHIDAVHLGRAYLHTDPTDLFHRASQLSAQTDLQIGMNRNPSQLHDLYAVQSRALGLMAYAALDLGRGWDAGTIARHGLACADRSGDEYLQAWSLGTLALISRFNDRDADSLTYSLKGLELKVAGTARCRLLSNAAESYANLGDPEETKKYLALSQEQLDVEVPVEHREDGIFSFPPARVYFYAASCLVQLPSMRSSAEAADQAEHAIRYFEAGSDDIRSVNDLLVAKVHLARARLQGDQLDGVLPALDPVLHAPPEYRTSWHRHFLVRLDAELGRTKRGSSSDGKELQSAIQNYLGEVATLRAS